MAWLDFETDVNGTLDEIEKEPKEKRYRLLKNMLEVEELDNEQFTRALKFVDPVEKALLLTERCRSDSIACRALKTWIDDSSSPIYRNKEQFKELREKGNEFAGEILEAIKKREEVAEARAEIERKMEELLKK